MREEHRLRVFESRVLRNVLGPKGDEVLEKLRRPHKEELYILYSSTNIIRVIKTRRLKSSGHVARMGKRRGAYRVLVGRHDGNRPIILKWIFKKWDRKAWTGLIWLRLGTGGERL